MSSAAVHVPSREFAGGEALFREGDPAFVMFVIESGSVRVTKLVDAQRTTLAELGAGDFVGELGLVSARPHNTTATALEPTRCLLLDSVALEHFVSTSPELAVRVVLEIGRRAHQAMHVLGIVGHRDSTARMIAAVARYADQGAARTSRGLLLGASMVEIGRWAAVGASEIGEIQQTMVRLRLIEVLEEGIIVPDLSRLYEFIEFAEV